MDEEFDEFNDAADDWELEAEEEQAREEEQLAQKALEQEKKAKLKAPAKAKAQVEAPVEEVLEGDVQGALDKMRQMASDLGTAQNLFGVESTAKQSTLLGDEPVDTETRARAVGEQMAKRLLEFSDRSSFNTILSTLFQGVGAEFQTVKALNEELSHAHVALEQWKKGLKAQKKKGSVVLHQHDALDFANVTDKGGAALAEGAKDELDW